MLEERLQPGEESYNIMVLSGRLRPTEFEPLKHDGNPNDESSSCSSFGSRTGIIDMTPRPLHPNLSRGSPFGPCFVSKNRHHFAKDPFAYRYTKDNVREIRRVRRSTRIGAKQEFLGGS